MRTTPVSSPRSSIATAIDGGVSTAGDVITAPFKDVLSAGDQTTLTTVVSAHLGIPLASPPSPVTLAWALSAADGRLVVRTTTASKTRNFNLRVFSFKPGDDTSLVNQDSNFNTLSDITIKTYDGAGAITHDSALAVKTVLDVEPTYNFEVIGGWIDVPVSIAGGTTGLWWSMPRPFPKVAA